MGWRVAKFILPRGEEFISVIRFVCIRDEAGRLETWTLAAVVVVLMMVMMIQEKELGEGGTRVCG